MKNLKRLLMLPAVAMLAMASSPAVELAASSPQVEQVVVVFKTHFDIGYTDMASNVIRRYQTTMIDDALKVVDQNRGLPLEQQFAWTLPGWPLSKIMEDWPGQTSERRQRIQQAFKDGRFVVHALPFTTHTELLEPEDLVRGLGFASRLARAASLELPRDAKMTDVPSHSWFMPTLLRNAGVDFLHLGCNAASSSPRVPRLFWWEGPDGSRLLTMYTAESYGTGLVPPADWRHKTWLALIHTGDNHGPPRPEEVKKLLDEAKRKLPGAKVRIGRLSDFADALLAEKPEIPFVRGDMPDTWIHGPMSDPQGAKLARNIRPAITTAELLNTLLRTWGVKSPHITGTMAKAYEQSLLYGEHTWGGAQYWITGYGKDTKWNYGEAWRADRAAGRFQRLEASWAEHTAYIEQAAGLVGPVLSGQMKTLVESVNHPGPRVAVFNPLPWERTDWVTVEMPGRAFASFRPADQAGVVPSATRDHTPAFLAGAVPPMGYRTFVSIATNMPAANVPVNAKQPTLENAFFRVLLDPQRGAIKRLADVRTGRNWVDGSSDHGFGQYLCERFDSNQVAAYVKSYVKISADWAINELGKPSLPPATQVPYQTATPRDCTFSGEQAPGWTTATMDSAASPQLPRITTRVVLDARQPYVDLEITIHNKPADPWPEAAWACLPFDIEAPQFRVGRLGSVIDPAKDIVSGANHDLYAVDTGVAVFGPDGRGFGICPLDSPLVSLGEPGGWKYATNSVPRRAAVFINLFNNQWTTNFRFWNEGTWTSRVRIWMFDRYDPWASLIKPSLEARFPLQAMVADGPAGALPLSAAGVAASGDGDLANGGGVLVSAFGPNPDGAGTLLRLWETSGKSGLRRLRFPPQLNVTSVQPVNLRGSPVGGSIAVQAGVAEIGLRAFAPFSCVLNPE